MNNDSQHLKQELILPFQDRIDILFHEIKLAVMWDRPSILFAIYKSVTVREEVNKILEKEFKQLAQKTFSIRTSNNQKFDLLSEISQCPDLSKTVFLIDGFNWKCGEKDEQILNEFNINREYFIDQNIRAIFWLFENEVMDFATNAAECWILRHRVVDFVDTHFQTQNPNQTPNSLGQESNSSISNIDNPFESSEGKENISNNAKFKTVRANGLLSLGLLFWRQGYQMRAQKFLKESSEISKSIPDNLLHSQVQNALALVYAEQGNTDAAIAAYKSAISLSSESAYLWNNLGQLLAKTERFDEAIIAYKNALSCSPEEFLSWEGIGHIYNKLGKYQNAITAFSKAIEISPSYEYSWMGIGKSHFESGQVDKAEASLRKALELNAHIIEAWVYLAKCLLEQKRDHDAISVYQRAIELNPHETELIIELGKLELKRQNYIESISAFQKSITLNPRCGEAYIKLAYSLFQIGDYEASASVYETGIPLFEDKTTRAVLLNNLGDAYLKMKDYERAIEVYFQSDKLRDETNEINKDEIELIHEIDNNTLNDTQITDQDVPLQEEGEEMNESNQIFDLKSAAEWNAHGNLHLRAGAYNDAIVAYTKAIELAPESCWPYIQNLAQVHYQKGKERGKLLVGKNEDPDIWEGEEELVSTAFPGFDSIQNPEQDGTAQEKESADSQTNYSVDLNPARIEVGLENSDSTYSDAGNITQEKDDVLEIADEVRESSIKGSVNNNSIGEVPQIPEAMSSNQTGESSKPQLVENAPQNSIDWNELGNSYTSTKNFENAIEAYRKAIEMNPGYGQPYGNLGFIYYCMGKYEVSIQLYKESINRLDTKEEKVISWNKLGDCYRRLGDYENALVAYQKASELTPAVNSVLARGKATLLENIFAH